jgi:hypothetical protein
MYIPEDSNPAASDAALAGKIIDFAEAKEALLREQAEAERLFELEARVRRAALPGRRSVHLSSIVEDLLLFVLLTASIATFVLLASAWFT